MKKFLSIFLVIVWMGVIFSFSNEKAEDSTDLSHEVVENVVVVLTDIEKDTPKMDKVVSRVNHPVRKCAHFFVYFVLGFLVMNAFYINGVSKKRIIYSTIICMLYSISDELHQLYVDGRSGQISDVLLDTSASIFCEYLYFRFIVFRGKYEKSIK